MEHYKYFKNEDCEFFPCHSGADRKNFSCLFCYCPLYPLGDGCGGNYSYLKNGIKDCSACLRPHAPENYDAILAAMEAVLELAKKQETTEEKP